MSADRDDATGLHPEEPHPQGDGLRRKRATPGVAADQCFHGLAALDPAAALAAEGS
jgi:hypothetical protein